MILTALNLESLQEQNKLELEEVRVEESLKHLKHSIHFYPGSWYQPLIQIDGLYLQSTILQNLKNYQSQKGTSALGIKYLRWKGTISLMLKIETDTITFHSWQDFIKLNHVPVQLGISVENSSQVVIYLTPKDIYDKIKEKYESLKVIQDNNSKESIINNALNMMTQDYQNLLIFVDKQIERRILNDC